jgi:hypothetical protein
MNAAAFLAQAIAAMGGEARLASLRTLTLDSVGHGWALEQSERPEGPWLSSYRQQKEVRDLEHQRRWSQAQRRDWSFPAWSPALTLVVADGVAARTNGQRWVPGVPGDVRDMQETFALAPERLLLTARAAGDLRVMPDETQQHVLQHVLAFTRNGQRLRLRLNSWTHLPTMMEVVHDDVFGIWGDVVERRWYSFWTLEKGGLRYPRQTSVEWNGVTYSDDTVQALTVDGPVDEAQFAIPAETRAAYAAAPPRPTGLASVPLDETKAIAITDSIVQLPGVFNVALVHQPDGVVVIEATTSGPYSAAVLAVAEKHFPGAKIKAVVTTSDAWPHVGGLREYVSRGIPIYALDLNVPILTRIAAAAHTFTPDTLARRPRAPIFKVVSERTVIGSGDTRIEILPVRGETGERMMIAWLPGAHVLYSSDLIQRDRPGTGFFMPEMLAEVATAVEREHIDGIERVMGMHLAPTPWADVTRAIATAKGGS